MFLLYKIKDIKNMFIVADGISYYDMKVSRTVVVFEI